VSAQATGSPAPFPALRTRTLVIRPLTRDDVPALTEYARESEMQRWTTVPEDYQPAHAESFVDGAVEGWERGTRFHLALETEDRFAGVADLRPQGGGLAEVGFGVAAWARGRGLMSSALRLLIPWGFEHAGFDLLRWQAQAGNWPSRRVAWAVGFRVRGVVPGLLEHRGRRVDGWMASLRREDPLWPVHPWFEADPIAGSRVRLRAHRPDDVPRVAEASRDPETQLWMPGKPAAYTDQDARGHLEGIGVEHAEGRAVFWAVADAEDRLVGEIGLFLRDLESGQGEIGYWTHPDARGRGLTTEAVRLAVRHALLPSEEGGLGLVRVLLRTARENVASQRVAAGAGFTGCGVDRCAEPLRDGRFVDNLRFELLRDDLPATW
jgi:RimJ/RimL family protein N-acetyltransferase